MFPVHELAKATLHHISFKNLEQKPTKIIKIFFVLELFHVKSCTFCFYLVQIVPFVTWLCIYVVLCRERSRTLNEIIWIDEYYFLKRIKSTCQYSDLELLEAPQGVRDQNKVHSGELPMFCVCICIYSLRHCFLYVCDDVRVYICTKSILDCMFKVLWFRKKLNKYLP